MDRVLYVRGHGLAPLKQYFAQLARDVPRKVPRDHTQWMRGDVYGAYHGLLEIITNGDAWQVTLRESCVEFCAHDSRTPEPSFDEIVMGVRELEGVTVWLLEGE